MPMPCQAHQGWCEGVTTRDILLEQLCSLHERPTLVKSERGIPNDYDLRHRLFEKWKGIYRLHKRQHIQTFSTTQMFIGQRKALGADFTRRLEALRPESIFHQFSFHSGRRCGFECYAWNGEIRDAKIQRARITLQPKRIMFRTDAKSNSEVSIYGRKPRKDSICGIKSKTQIGTIGDTKESWYQN